MQILQRNTVPGTHGQSICGGNCQSAPCRSSDRDTNSSRGSKGRNFRGTLKATQPPSGSGGLRDRPAPTAHSQTSAHVQATRQSRTTREHLPSPRGPSCRHLALKYLQRYVCAGSATSVQLCSKPDVAPPTAEHNADFL